MSSVLKAFSLGPYTLKLEIGRGTFFLREFLTSSAPLENTFVLLIVLLFIGALFLFFKHLFLLRFFFRNQHEFKTSIFDMIYEEKTDAALIFCRESKVPAAKVIEKGLLRIGRPLSEVSQSMENLVRGQIFQIEKGVRILLIIAGGAPMLGFLGILIKTVITFYSSSQGGIESNPYLLAREVYGFTSTTAAGWFVGLSAYIFYHLLMIKINHIAAYLKNIASDFIDLIDQPIH